MEIEETSLPGVLHLSPRVFGDERGYFVETHSTKSFPGAAVFVQDNLSFSRKGTLRGLHLQHPQAQGKLVMALTGEILDVAVDVRVGSPHFGKWVARKLTGEKKNQLYVPPGFAHGFCVISETAHVLYKCTELYAPDAEMSVRFNDPSLGIEWPTESPLLSEKDEKAPLLGEIPEASLPRFVPERGAL